jgi:hypothetical protein
VTRVVRRIMGAAACLGATAALAGCGSASQTSAGHSPVPGVRPGPCALHASPATLGAQVGKAKSGQTVCLATGNYGKWTGTGKAIVLAAAPHASPVMSFRFDGGAHGFTLSGIRGLGGQMAAGAHDITIENSSFTSAVAITGLANANVTFDHDTFVNINNPGCGGQPARIHLEYGTSIPSGVTVEDSLFSGGDTDGIQTGAPLVIKNNVFTNLRSPGSDCNHTDSIQGVGSTGVVVVGNLFYNDYDGAVDFDGPNHWRVTDNVCYDIDRGACVSLYGDLGSRIDHNTAGLRMRALELDRKPSERSGRGTVFTNNVGPVSVDDGCSMATDAGNLYARAKAPDLNGVPRFAGGKSPTTWSGFALKSIAGRRAEAARASDVGIRRRAAGPPLQPGAPG